jgi:hypothetical protein
MLGRGSTAGVRAFIHPRSKPDGAPSRLDDARSNDDREPRRLDGLTVVRRRLAVVARRRTVVARRRAVVARPGTVVAQRLIVGFDQRRLERGAKPARSWRCSARA